MRHLYTAALAVIFLVVVGCPQPGQAQELTTFILVRHAEKADDGTADPVLSAAGQARARALREHLAAADITAIYSTPYRRTQQTVRPLARAAGLEIQPYQAFDKATLQRMLDRNRGGTIIVAGHSNTTPLLANLLIGSRHFEAFDESAYGNLLVITVDEIGSGQLLHLQY